MGRQDFNSNPDGLGNREFDSNPDGLGNQKFNSIQDGSGNQRFNSIQPPFTPPPSSTSQPSDFFGTSPFAPGAQRQGLADLDAQRQAAISQAFNLANTFGGGVQALEQAKQAGSQNLRQQAGKAIAGSFGGAGQRVAGGGGTAGLRQAALESGNAQAMFGVQAQQQIQQQQQMAQEAQLNAQIFQQQAGTQFTDAQGFMGQLAAEHAQLSQLDPAQREEAMRGWMNRVLTQLPPEFQARFLFNLNIDPTQFGLEVG